ncbi:MAG: hypothetical protein ACKVX9_19335 [Blastocatellia bacterium]
MAKEEEKDTPDKGSKPKGNKNKDRNVLIGRVKKVVKKSRRKLGEEKFEKELLRTISFLEGLQVKLAQSHAAAKSKAKPAPDPKAAKKTAPKAAKKRRTKKARAAK